MFWVSPYPLGICQFNSHFLCWGPLALPERSKTVTKPLMLSSSLLFWSLSLAHMLNFTLANSGSTTLPRSANPYSTMSSSPPFTCSYMTHTWWPTKQWILRPPSETLNFLFWLWVRRGYPTGSKEWTWQHIFLQRHLLKTFPLSPWVLFHTFGLIECFNSPQTGSALASLFAMFLSWNFH